MPKKQKDINCGVNNDGNTITEESTNADPGIAARTAINAAVAKADGERVNFRALSCPNTADKNCPVKSDITGEKEDIKRSCTLSYDNDTKKWTAKAMATWEASFKCSAQAKKKTLPKKKRRRTTKTPRQRITRRS